MFGLVTPCRHSLPDRLHQAWTAHLCGLCLTLRDRHGHQSRVATNVDAVLVSVLVAAQRPDLATTRRAGACALRGLRSAEVIRSDAPASRLAGGVSLLLAGGMLRDHAADGDLARPVRPVAALLGGRWESAGRTALAEVGLDAAELAGVAERAGRVERGSSGPDAWRTVTAPTEAAVSAALAHTARIAGRPGNEGPLARAGRLIGRIAHLTDALVDRPDDDRRGRWNPLTATDAVPAAVVAEIEQALAGVRAELELLDLPGRRPGAAPEAVLQADLVRTLLGESLPRSVRRLLTRAGHLTAGCRSGPAARRHRDECARSVAPDEGARSGAPDEGAPSGAPRASAPEPELPPGHHPAVPPWGDTPASLASGPPVGFGQPGPSAPTTAGGRCFSRCCSSTDCCECGDCGDCCDCGDCGDCGDCCDC